MDWSVTIDTVGDEATGDEAEAVGDLLFDVGGVVNVGPEDALGVTVAVTAMSCLAAIEQALARFADACGIAEVGARRIVGVKAVEWSHVEADVR